jgi:hypothetical protein
VTRTDYGVGPPGGAPEGATVSIESSFEQIVGRKASEPERARLYRLRDALGLRDNDAFWSIVMALEHYDSFFRAYPAQLAEVTERTLGSVRVACAAAAEKEVAAIQRALTEQVAVASAALARKLADRPLGLHRVAAALAAVVAFGSLCVHAGYELAASGRPFWMHPSEEQSSASRVLMSVLSAPAGWMIFALLVPVAVQGARFGWRMAVDPLAEGREHALGWCIVVCCVLGCGACALMLARLA